MAWLGAITNNGNDPLIRWVEGENPHIIRAATGQGRVEQAAMLAQSALVNEEQTVSIMSNTSAEKGQKLKLQMTTQVAVGYSLNQFGVWARLDGGEDQMITLFQTDTDTDIEIPSKGVIPDFVYTFYGLLAFSNQGNLTVKTDAAAVVMAEAMGQAIDGTMGAHTGDREAHAALLKKKADLSADRKVVIGQLPVNTPNGVAGLDKDGKANAAQMSVNVPSGVAGLDDDGKIAAAQLPSCVDDVVEGYYHEGAFYSDPAHREQIAPESGKVYIDAETSITYRQSGHSYAPIGSDLALGEAQSTACHGDQGKIAYDHNITREGGPHSAKAADIDYTDNRGLGAKNLQGAMDATAQRIIGAQKSADTALDAITKIGHTIDAVPSQNGTLTYTGSEQNLAWNSYSPETVTMGGVTKGTDAGSYNATFTPKEGYTWGDGTNETKTIVQKIGWTTIMTVPSQSGALAYTGSAQTPNWANYESTKLTLGKTTSGTDAGSYEATFMPKGNYQWQDGSAIARTATWRVKRAEVAVMPGQSGALTYTGGVQSPSWSSYDSTELTMGGTASGVAADNYNTTFTPREDYQWQDGGVAAKNTTWIIQKAASTLTLSPASMTLNASAKSKSITVTKNGTGAVSATTSSSGVVTVSVSRSTVTVTAVKDGDAIVTVNVAAGASHTAPSAKTCSVKVEIPNTYGVE